MQKIINAPERFVDEVVDAILTAHPGRLAAASADRRAVVRVEPAGAGPTVRIVTGGGSGHLPLFLGYVGAGLASGVAVGNVFSSPSPHQILAATEPAAAARGALYLYGNYGGDVYNFDIAAELARAEGCEVRTVLGADDLLSAPPERARDRRGVAGLVFAYKTAGAAAARGDDLAGVAEIAQRTVDRTRTVGVGLSPTILPAAGKPTFTLPEGHMEIGIGIHGESGLAQLPIEPADAIAERLVGHLDGELSFSEGKRLAVLVNGLGATPLEELYVLYGRVRALVEEAGSSVAWSYVGEYATSLEMAGASVSILELDDELLALLEAPASSPFYHDGFASHPAASPASPALAAPAVGRPVAVDPEGRPGRLRALAIEVMGRMPAHADELRELDAALGDGDLGITVGDGARSVVAALDALPDEVAAKDLLREAGAAFAEANPSTFAALVGMAAIEASAAAPDTSSFGREESIAFGERMAASIARRGGAAVGDKTMLDVLVPALEQLREGADLRDVSVYAAELVSAGAALQSSRGRAAWHGERSVGHPDPGSAAVQRFLEELARVVAEV